MDKILIKGGKPLYGSIQISGAKNAALPLMAASLLTNKSLVLTNLPHLADISTMANLLTHLGAKISMAGEAGDNGHTGRSLRLETPKIRDTTAPYDLVRRMRASILVLGPLIARTGEARVSLPGGCAIGARPVDLHLKHLRQLGAKIEMEEGYISATAPHGLRGADITFPTVSVGATENLLMAACLAEGETVLNNVAREPEIADLTECLIKMGADIRGMGTDTLVIQGKEVLFGAEHVVVADRIETGTYAMAAAVTGGEVILTGSRVELLQAVLDKLIEAGVSIEDTKNGITIRRNGLLKGVDVMTEPFPGFPTDLQAQMTALMSIAEGAAMITESIFENRFMHIPELARMGANVTVHGASSLVRGVDNLKGAPVMATDLRASASLILAGLVAKGETIINRVYHIDRGYERIEEKLAACGAEIERLDE
ncbi:MAG: UDP-N-acetylglucosamine 1-carboxyvinyltransferase [Pseudomonadota bacterium]|nr:UDP-N-acetylglucosamine 1-carboxyvinyltransferase [Pseudomonadota bacterium]